MNELVTIIPALVTGLLLGTLFFGGLWWTIRKGISSPRPARWFVVSLLLRTSITLVGFYVASDGHWLKLLMCLFGFTLARLLVTRFTRFAEKPSSLAQEASHAP